jgi:hypothetical protein
MDEAAAKICDKVNKCLATRGYADGCLDDDPSGVRVSAVGLKNIKHRRVDALPIPSFFLAPTFHPLLLNDLKAPSCTPYLLKA